MDTANEKPKSTGKTLIASEQPIARVFSDDYVFAIPDYQRPYSWTTEQATELIDDLIDARERALESSDRDTPYFLGSIVLIKQEGAPDAQVVDGQQRLTTLTLLLAAIRAGLTNPSARSDLSKRIYEEGDSILGTPNRYRIALRQRDRDFFRSHVQDEDGISKLVTLDGKLSDSQDNLRRNAVLFMQRLESMNEADSIALAGFVLKNCFLVTICTPDLDSAYRIFDVLNSRGLDLSATDILKAEIIGQISEAKRALYSKRWEDIEEELGRESFGNLFSHIRMIFRKTKPKGTLLKEFHDAVAYSSPESFIGDTLAPLADAYATIIHSDYTSRTGAEAVNRHLMWINRIEFSDWIPPALKFLALHRNEAERVTAFFAELERLAYGMLIAKWGINARIERYSKLTTAIETGADLYTEGSPLLLAPHEKYSVYVALDGPLYTTHAVRSVRLILLRLDALLSSGEASYAPDGITIEHVLPQNPPDDSQWTKWFPDADAREYWVNRLGNLVLLNQRKNSSASNRDFAWKKSSYFVKNGVTPFAITTQVLQEAVWKPETTEYLQEARLAALEHHFGLEGRAESAVAPPQGLGAHELFDLAGLFYCTASGADARARCTSKGMLVLSGSTGRTDVVNSLKNDGHAYQRLRADLHTQGIITDLGNDRIMFQCDHLFTSPSAAAAAVTGRPANGWREWRDDHGRTLRDVCTVAARAVPKAVPVDMNTDTAPAKL